MSRLNIFIDETGEFGFGRGSAKLYGVSLVFHEQNDDIKKEVAALNSSLGYLEFHSMVHMGDLVAGHGDFSGMDVAKRRKIYNCLYRFSTQIPAKYHTFIIDKKNSKNSELLSQSIKQHVNALILEHLTFFQDFNEIVVYYDGGQAILSKVIEDTFGKLSSYRRKTQFDHTEKKLFQVADMLTYLDKIIYKHRKGIRLTKTEQRFFSKKKIITSIKELKSRQF